MSPTARWRHWMWAAAVTVAVASSVGTVAYVATQADNITTSELHTQVEAVCARQDQVIDSIRATLRALDLAFTQTVPGAVQVQVTDDALRALNRLRVRVARIEASPCTPSHP